MSESMISKPFFQAGGSLPSDIPSYISRKADDELYEYLIQGQFCFVLTARQMGKSSLKVRTMERLLDKDWSVANVDLTAFGTTDFTSEQWYFSFLMEIAEALDLEDIFEEWWDRKQKLTPVARMSLFWEEIVLKNTSQNIGIFIDEIDTMLSLDREKFSTDDFFASIRATYNKRGTNPQLKRLNVCIFGVAAPSDLMYDHERTPFNIGVGIKLSNFTLKEAQPLVAGVSCKPETGQQILKRIIYWTNGQPYLTQKVFQRIANRNDSNSKYAHLTETQVHEHIDQLISDLFLTGNIISSETHFSNIQTRIIFNDTYNLRILELYQKLLKGEQLQADNKAPEQLYIKLSGIAYAENGELQISNRIYQKVFKQEWLADAYGGINRPFSVDLQRWLKNERSRDALLVGTVLKQAEEWAEQRHDLTEQERDYLEASRIAAVETHQEALRNQENRRQQKRMRIALIFITFLAVFATASAIIAGFLNRTAKERLEMVNSLNENLLSRQMDLLESRFSNEKTNYLRLTIEGRSSSQARDFHGAEEKFEEARIQLNNFQKEAHREADNIISFIDEPTMGDFPLIRDRKNEFIRQLDEFYQQSIAEIVDLKAGIIEAQGASKEIAQLLTEAQIAFRKGDKGLVDARRLYRRILLIDKTHLEARERLSEIKARWDTAFEDFVNSANLLFDGNHFIHALKPYKEAYRMKKTQFLEERIRICNEKINSN